MQQATMPARPAAVPDRKTSTEQIEILLRARLPVLWTVSYEENRVVADVAATVQVNNTRYGANTEVWEWSATKGMRRLVGGPGADKPDLVSPVDAMEMIEGHTTSAVFILKDFGHFLNSGTGYLVQRMLRDAVDTIVASVRGSSILILDSQLQVPDRIEKDVAVVDFDLPTTDELLTHLSPMVAECPAFTRLPTEERDDLLYTGVRCALGLTLTEAENVFSKSLAEVGTVDPHIITGEKKHIIRRSGVLEFFDTRAGMGSVGGLDVLKGWLRNRSRAYTKEAKDYGLPSPKGILLVGIPGTGKSLVSKCVGVEWNMPVLRMDVGALFGSYVGESEGNMRKALRTAEALAPCVLWVDEIEKSIGSGGGSLDGGTTSRVFASLLSWMQDKKADVFVVATANDVSSLPPEMLRKGRFDEMFFVDLPDLDSRREILSIHIGKAGRDPADFDVDLLAERSVNLSGAELESAVQAALFVAFDRGGEPTTEDILAAVQGTVPLLTTMKEKIDNLRAWARSRAKPACSKPPESAVELEAKAAQASGTRRPMIPTII